MALLSKAPTSQLHEVQHAAVAASVDVHAAAQLDYSITLCKHGLGCEHLQLQVFCVISSTETTTSNVQSYKLNRCVSSPATVTS